MFAEDFEHIGEQRDAGAEEDEADDIEGMACLFAVVGQMEIDHDEADEADGDIEEEDDAPVEVADDEAAGDGAEHGRDERGDGDEAHGADEFGFGEGADQREPADRDHHGAAQPCRMRQATSRWMLLERPQSSEPRVKRPMAEAKTRRVPNRSAIQPLMGMKTARLRV